MSVIDNINNSLTSFLGQQTIYEAQIKAFKNLLSKQTADSLSRSYLLHLTTLLVKGTHNGKLTPEGKQKGILAQNPDGEILIPVLPGKLKEKIGLKNQDKGNSKEIKKSKESKKSKIKALARSKKAKLISLKNFDIEKEEKSKQCLFKQYGSLTIGELFVKFNTSFYTLLHILGQNDKQDTEFLTEAEFEKLSPLISSRLETIKRNEKAEKRITTPRIKKPVYRPSNSDRVFGEIYKCGGLGKIIYTRMKE